MNLDEDTIVAIATPPGVGAISIIRLSGAHSFSSIENIFSGKKKILEMRSHTIQYGKIIDAKNEIIDDVLISIFHNPNSYTGEDSVEISTHGNPIVTQKIIELLLKQGLRIAEPGEFTKRAFLNGKIDLTQAEAVVELINARSEASLRGARNQIDGLLSQKVNELKEMIINSLSLVELELDFAEEDLIFIERKELLTKMQVVKNELSNLLKTFSFGKLLRDGVNVAIVGLPNVGKSSLLNYLLKESRAIVSLEPGTTRDIIREEILIDGILFRIFDTAGIRETKNPIEEEGVQRSRDAIKIADVVIFLSDITEDMSRDLYNEIGFLTEADKIISVANKVDVMDKKIPGVDVYISAKTGLGVQTLIEQLKRKAIGGYNYSEKNIIVSSIRHYNSLKLAENSIEKAINSINTGLSGEFISIDLRRAADSLGEIIGTITTDDILNNIFSKFCIGK
jgi:tRNA modification GTPase